MSRERKDVMAIDTRDLGLRPAEPLSQDQERVLTLAQDNRRLRETNAALQARLGVLEQVVGARGSVVLVEPSVLPKQRRRSVDDYFPDSSKRRRAKR